MTINTKQNVQG